MIFKRPIFSLVAFAVLAFLASPFPALAQESSLKPFDEYKLLAYKLNTYRQAFDPANKSISPGLDHLKKQYEAVSAELELKKRELTDIFSLAVSAGDRVAVKGAVDYICNVRNSDPSYPAFEALRGLLRQKLEYEAVASGEDQGRREFLLKMSEELGKTVLIGTTPVITAPARGKKTKARPPVYIAFHWHMHQPIYWPYEDIVTTHNRGVYSYSLFDVMHSRAGAYTSWPYDAVKAAADAGLPHAGAQVSFSGSLIENLEAMKKAGAGFGGWENDYRAGTLLRTAGGNPRLDMVAFGFHHPLMALLDYEDIRRQVQEHKKIFQRVFGQSHRYSKGMFPPENAFAEWMIPALVDEGIEWVFVDNIHFSRACENYPWVKGENLYPPNRADEINPDPKSWVQLSGLWAPSKVTPWANKPYYVVYRDPATGEPAKTPGGKVAKMIAVPTDRYMGNEDGRGGFGALNYEQVISQLEEYNTDPKRPLLIVLHHDGDNFGGGSWGYYHDNFRRFVDWVRSNPERFVCTTVQDYLDKFPPPADETIHVESGSWAGADNGDPEFLKWNGDCDPKTGYSPDRNSWGIMTAAKNFVLTAESVAPDSPATKEAWRYMLVSQTSCYEYWDGTEMWDSHPARAANRAVALAREALDAAGGFEDKTPPTIYKPQREPYNPGGIEWGDRPMPSDFTVWTCVYDMSGLNAVELQYAEVSRGGAPVAAWKKAVMTGKDIPSQTNPKPSVKALEYSYKIAGKKNTTYAYRVAASDKHGNESYSPVNYVFVGAAEPPEPEKPCWTPQNPGPADQIIISAPKSAKLHWGINGWKMPPESIWPAGTEKWPDGKSVETVMTPAGDGKTYSVRLGPFPAGAGGSAVGSIDFVFHYSDGSWGSDRKITIGR